MDSRKEKNATQKQTASAAFPGLSAEEIRLLSAYRVLNATGQSASLSVVEGIAKDPLFRRNIRVEEGVIYINFLKGDTP